MPSAQHRLLQFATPDTANSTSTKTDRIITWILVICVVLPFIVASILQCLFVLKRRRRQRQERALERVNAHPGGRALILEMLFKENVKEVKEGEIEKKKKKRVLVKKRRKKTEEERRGDPREDEGGGGGDEQKKKWLWWGEERVRRDSTVSQDDRIVVCISSDGLETDMENIIGAASDKRYSGGVDDSDRPLVLDEEMGLTDIKVVEGENEEEQAVESVSDVTHVAIADEAMSHAESLFPTNDDSGHTEQESEQDANDLRADSTETKVASIEDSKQPQLQNLDGSSAAGEDDNQAASPQLCHEVKTPKTTNYNEKEPHRRTSSTLQRLNTPELQDYEAFGNMTVQLAPRIKPQRSNEDTTKLPQVLEPPFIQSNGPGNVSPMSPCFGNGEDAWTSDPSRVTPARSPALIMPELDFDNNSNISDTPNQQALASPPSIFRKRDSDDSLNAMDLQRSMSNDTAVASNVDEAGKSEILRGDNMSNITPADIVPSHKLKSTESYKTDGSSISYFSYEDVSIEDEESEMCAVCLCPYEEGDIRVFSKHCSHVFHKECIFEWLVKGHNECPCCRTDMVTKSEIRSTSASLIGTEQLNHAMQQATVEAPPFRARRGPRLPRHLNMSARREAWREWRMNHLANSRSASNNNNGASASAATSPTNNNHNVDWLWTMRFDNMANQISSPSQLRTARSSDALDNTRPSGTALATRVSDGRGEGASSGNAMSSRSFDALDSQRAGASSQQSLQHHVTAGSLVVGRNLHPNWGNCQSSGRQNLAMSPISHRLHPHWQQHRTSRRDEGPPLVEIPPRPAVQPISPPHT